MDGATLVNHRSNQPERVTEHAVALVAGGMQVRSAGPDIERVYPLDVWIEHQQRHGSKVYRRTVIVVSDWEEVPPVDTPRQGG